MSLVFFGAGVSKLRHAGLEWIGSENLANLLIRGQYGAYVGDPLTTLGLEIARHAWLYQSLAAATVGLELGYPLALVSRRVRRIAAPGGLALLIGIWVLMGIGFVPLMICHLFWVPWDRVGRRLSEWVRPGPGSIPDAGMRRTA